MDNIIQYGYKYEEKYDIYLVRRLDDSFFDCVPCELFRNILIEEKKRTNGCLNLEGINGFIHFNSLCNAAIVDLKGRSYTLEMTDRIVSDIESQYTNTRKGFLNRLRLIRK